MIRSLFKEGAQPRRAEWKHGVTSRFAFIIFCRIPDLDQAFREIFDYIWNLLRLPSPTTYCWQQMLEQLKTR